MATRSARTSATALRRQAGVLRWLIPVMTTLSCLGAVFWADGPTVFFAAVAGAIIGTVAGMFMANRLEAAADALDCQSETLEAVRALGNQLATMISTQHKQTIEVLRMLGEQMVNGNVRSADLLSVVAENTNAQSRSG